MLATGSSTKDALGSPCMSQGMGSLWNFDNCLCSKKVSSLLEVHCMYWFPCFLKQCFCAKSLTLKVTRKILEQTTIYFCFLFFRENNAWHYMWIVCQADDSQVMSSIIFSKKIWKTCFESVVCQLWLALKGLTKLEKWRWQQSLPLMSA